MEELNSACVRLPQHAFIRIPAHSLHGLKVKLEDELAKLVLERENLVALKRPSAPHRCEMVLDLVQPETCSTT